MSVRGNEMKDVEAVSDKDGLDATEKQTLVQVHLAEYQALTNRNTYSIFIRRLFGRFLCSM